MRLTFVSYSLAFLPFICYSTLIFSTLFPQTEPGVWTPLPLGQFYLIDYNYSESMFSRKMRDSYFPSVNP